MPRKLNRFAIQSGIFVVALIILLYINRPQNSSDKLLPWTKIRYKAATEGRLDSRGVCPNLAGSKIPALVVARVAADGDPSWTDALSHKYHRCIYTVDTLVDLDSKFLQVPANRGHEAMVYLTFIIDNYYHIPEAGVVFVHGSRWAWHNDEQTYDNVVLLKLLDVPKALEPWGYHNLRCDWSASTCPPSVKPQGSIETSLKAIISPWDARAVSDSNLPASFKALFGRGEEGYFAELGKHATVRSQCCAQFVVSRENILQHTLDEYIALRQWLLDSSRDVFLRDDRVAGRIISYLWHVLFIKRERIEDNGAISLNKLNSAACPTAADCYCRLYGFCNLENCDDDHCYGRYKIPPNFKIPDDWASKHS